MRGNPRVIQRIGLLAGLWSFSDASFRRCKASCADRPWDGWRGALMDDHRNETRVKRPRRTPPSLWRGDVGGLCSLYLSSLSCASLLTASWAVLVLWSRWLPALLVRARVVRKVRDCTSPTGAAALDVIPRLGFLSEENEHILEHGMEHMM